MRRGLESDLEQSKTIYANDSLKPLADNYFLVQEILVSRQIKGSRNHTL